MSGFTVFVVLCHQFLFAYLFQSVLKNILSVKSKWSVSSLDKHVGLSDVHYVCGLLDVTGAEMYQTAGCVRGTALVFFLCFFLPHTHTMASVWVKDSMWLLTA